jgi:putative nucleotidyltransferase with HDIG domain
MLLVDKEEFRLTVTELEGMPALPGIMNKLNRMMKDPSFSVESMAEELGKDQAMAAKILKLVNSAFYGFPGRISSLTHAVVLLGFDVIKGVLLSAYVFDHMREKMLPLWIHSLAVSKAAGLIAKTLEEPQPEEITLAGLLHDIGKVVFSLKIPEQYALVLQAAATKGLPPLVAERKLFGFDHADVAYWMCGAWNLPERLAIPMGYHHKIRVPRKLKRQTAILALADLFVKASGFGSEGDTPIK